MAVIFLLIKAITAQARQTYERNKSLKRISGCNSGRIPLGSSEPYGPTFLGGGSRGLKEKSGPFSVRCPADCSA